LLTVKPEKFKGFVTFPKGYTLHKADLRELRELGYLPAMAGGAAAVAPGQAVAPAAIPALPFTASAHEHTEPAFTLTVTPGTGVQVQNPIDIPAYGYIRHIFLEVSAVGGVGGTGNPDYPWNILSSINLADVNGANIYGPLDGYAAYVTNLLGGYSADPLLTNAPGFVGSAPNPVFYLRIPVEISHKDGLGSLSNQNSAANYKLNLAVNTIAATTSAAYTTPPVITIRGWLEAWTLPSATDGRGRPQAQVPPMLGTGQLWTQRTQSILVGSNTVSMTRVGNLIRLLGIVTRDGTGARVDTVFPDPASLNWDGMTIHNASQRYLKNRVFEQVQGKATFTWPAGVWAFLFNTGGADQSVGNESPDLWLPTTQSSRLEIVGTSAVAGTAQILTNEVSPVEQDQTERYMEHSSTAWQGQVAQGAPYSR
jgi:hypothetical protein